MCHLQLDLADLQKELDKSRSVFPENPSVWVKDLAGYLNYKLQAPRSDPVLSQHPHGPCPAALGVVGTGFPWLWAVPTTASSWPQPQGNCPYRWQIGGFPSHLFSIGICGVWEFTLSSLPSVLEGCWGRIFLSCVISWSPLTLRTCHFGWQRGGEQSDSSSSLSIPQCQHSMGSLPSGLG